MTTSVKSLGVDRLNVEERLSLVEEIWASICAESGNFVLTDAQRLELESRVADDNAYPDEVIPWEEVKTSIRTRLAR